MKTDQCCPCPEVLAMAAVPLQEWCEPYDWNTALSEGTIFPFLNLPFFKAPEGKTQLKPTGSSLDPVQKEREALMGRISSISFAINDLTLYLDTHPTCTKGAPVFYELTKMRLELLAEYAQKYYPLTQSSIVTGNLNPECYGWAEGPMPWEGGCI